VADVTFHDDVPNGPFKLYLLEFPQGVGMRQLLAVLAGIDGELDFIISPLDDEGNPVLDGGVGPRYIN